MYEILLIVLLLDSIALVGLILLQQGKGADMGASFGAGASATLFGSSGSGNFMSRTTAVLAAIFFAICLTLSYISSKPKTSNSGAWDDISAPVSQQSQAVKPEPVTPTTPNSDIPQ